MKVWRNRTSTGSSTTWVRYLTFWRIQVGYGVHRHAGNAAIGDRWVFHPSFVYDRKPPGINPERNQP